ncbi:hypothetical protein DPMN_036615 [Dreissena polymorpha]|uniref:Uncharacterized protein n=1 Tax=Dreissena polymorpha TaxID=45954 RepID=A0A9D4MBU5_DREPO|nr:hypothetical protein DPMN_036615 [Dreissena polymorpha]
MFFNRWGPFANSSECQNVTSRVFTCFHYIHIEKIAPPTGHVFNRSGPFSNSFHDDWAKIVTSCVLTRKTAPPPPLAAILGMKCDFYNIIGTNLLTKFHDDRTKNVASRVFTRKTASPTGSHIGHEIFELDRDFIRTKLLTNFHEDRTINVASRVFTNKCGRTDRQRTKTGHKSSLEQSINRLTKFHQD